MKRTGFIIAVESYLLRKGLASVLNRIPGAYVACEFAEAGPLLECLKTCSDEYILISQSLFQLVRLASMGYTNREIAEKLFLSSHTVTTHRRNISSKLGIKSLSALTVYAIVNNIISIEELSSLPDQ
jgi:DNA-binding CsgD family transcriptional regulator